MAEARALLRYAKLSPQKARLVVDLIRGKNAGDAMNILKFTMKRSSKIISKVLRSAVANAEQKDLGDVDALKVSRVFVDGGPVHKRFQAICKDVLNKSFKVMCINVLDNNFHPF